MKNNYEEGLESFLGEAKKAYARMFEAEHQADLVTFSQREVCVYEEGRRLSRFLLETHLAQDKDSQLQASETATCPTCQRPSKRVDANEVEIRPMTTLVGDIVFSRAKYRCKPCRKFFFH